MFTIGGAFLCSDAAGRGSLEQSVMTTEGFACWLSTIALLCCREVEPDTFPAHSEDLSSTSQDWRGASGDLTNDTEASCSACSDHQTGQCQYSCFDHEPHPKQSSRLSAISDDMTQHIEHQAQKMQRHDTACRASSAKKCILPVGYHVTSTLALCGS